MKSPEFVYRILRGADWAQAQATGRLPYSELDLRDGFFHLSTAHQTLETARIHFAGAVDLLAAEIPAVDLEDALAFEESPNRPDEVFPHYYGEIPVTRIHRMMKLDCRGKEFSFGETI